MQKLVWLVIGIIVAGGLFTWYYMDRIDEIRIDEVEITDTVDPQNVTTTDPCILNVMIPQPDDVVGASFEVSGEASDCINWGGVTVYDDMDNVLSAFAITIGETAEEGVAPFFVQPELRFEPETQTGYIEVHSADESVRQRVDIVFEEDLAIIE